MVGFPPFHTPKWSFLVGKPMVVGYHNFRRTPYGMYDKFKHIYQSHTSVMGKIIQCILGFGDSSMLGNRKYSPKWWIWPRPSGSRYSPDKIHHEHLRGPSPSKRTWHWGSGLLKFSCHVMTDGTWIVLGPFWCCICQPLFHGRCNLPHTTGSEKLSLGAKNNTWTYTLCFFARWHGMLRN